MIKPKREQDFKLLPDECVFEDILDKLEDYPVSIKNIRRRKVNKSNSEYCFLNTGDLFFVNEMGDVYPCPTHEGRFYMGNINLDIMVPFKVNSGICFARKVLFA
ncbi:MAG: hypothetical protein LRZ92_00130 [Methanosarcinaceae archaeon]|jgi:uncharacterized protein|nr:hypothetical protein [Methanosarcinaceae archaeon]NKQ38061.1 hypothetical protein [Methanosarcinales archaeon]